MQIIRQIVERESIRGVTVPEEFGAKVQIIILPLTKTDKDSDSDSEYLMKFQENTGFALQVLADPAEDVWNDI